MAETGEREEGAAKTSACGRQGLLDPTAMHEVSECKERQQGTYIAEGIDEWNT